MGEDVDNYVDGAVANHDGTWLAGRDGARPGLLVRGDPEPGFVYYSEHIPGQKIVERNTVESVTESFVTPAGPVEDGMLVTAEKEDGSTETKLYARGVGLVEERTPDDFVVLESVTPA